MRGMVGVIAMVATVMHFTFGCCLHPCHRGGHTADPCSGSQTGAVDVCCHEDGHATGCDEQSCHERSMDHGEAGSGIAALGSGRNECHGDCHACGGCQCAATSAPSPPTCNWSPAVAFVVTTPDGDSPALRASLSEDMPPDPCVDAGRRRHLLLERFLI